MMRHQRRGLLAAAALAAGLAAGAAMAQTPIDACTTITDPGSYILTQNINATNLDTFEGCIVLSTDHVTLNLNGFAIIGEGTGVGISDDSLVEGITVRNGAIANFGAGIDIDSTSRCKLENLRAFNSTGNPGFQQFQGAGFEVRSACIISGTIAAGNRLAGYAVSVERVLLSGNISRGNNSAGIRPENFSLVTGNVVEGHPGSFSDGIQPREGSLVTGNAVHNNGGAGIVHLGIGGDPNSLAATNNAVTENAQGGLELIPINDDDGVLAIYNTFRSNPAGNQVGTCTNCTIPPDHNRF